MSALGKISSDTGLLPKSVGSLQGLEKHGGVAAAMGETTDIWKGSLNNKQVAFKVLRSCASRDLQEIKKNLWKLVPIWKRLIHENVLPFHGVDTSIFQLALVYDWCDNGNITQYLKSHPDASRPKLVNFPPRSTCIRCSELERSFKLLQVAKGLQYLHSLNVIHENVKGVRGAP